MAKKQTEPRTANKSLDSSMEEIQKKWGQGSVMYLGSNAAMNVEVVPTGVLEIDIALGVNGLPLGRVVEVFGNESSGKSTLALHVVKEAQKKGLQCAYVDAEHALDPSYARAIGVNIEDLIIAQPSTGEEGLDICLQLCKSGQVGVIIVDSVAALVPRAEIEGDIGDSHVGLQARLMSQSLRMITGEANKNHTMVLFINQLREKIGVMFGNPEVTTGGRALKFYSSVRISTTRLSESLGGKGNDSTGNKVRVKIVKNKVAPPFRQCDVDVEYGKGFSEPSSVLNLALEAGLIAKKGAHHYDANGEAIGNGREAAKAFLAENPEYMQSLREQVIALGVDVDMIEGIE